MASFFCKGTNCRWWNHPPARHMTFIFAAAQIGVDRSGAFARKFVRGRHPPRIGGRCRIADGRSIFPREDRRVEWAGDPPLSLRSWRLSPMPVKRSPGLRTFALSVTLPAQLVLCLACCCSRASWDLGNL